MQQNFSKISFLTGSESALRDITSLPSLPVFSEKVIKFFSLLSNEILKDKRAKDYPDVCAYAFFIRKASLLRLQAKINNSETRVGRGVAFHIAPSNVPVNFAVSLTDALLAGNANIVRVSNKEFAQVDIICDAINKVVKVCSNLKDYIQIIRYPHDEAITEALSQLCDIRIIWGGNETIKDIRKAQLPPRAVELSFADRHSLCIIDADAYLEEDSLKIAKDFYIDTYYTDQNACSSPRLVVWVGNNIKQAQTVFWNSLDDLVKKEYPLQPIQAVNKLDSLCRFAIYDETARLSSKDNYVMRVQLQNLTENTMAYKENSGYFFEYEAKELSEIVPILTKQCQTISYLGIEPQNILKVVVEAGVRGVDRIVPLGKTMDISIYWDGYDMINAMSRLIYVEDKGK